MTMLEYLLYLKDNKGILFDSEARLNEILPEDKEKLIRQGFISVDDYLNGLVTVYLRRAGEEFLLSLN